MNVRKLECEGVDLIYLSYDWNQLQALMNTLMNLCFIKVN
jgi:hypothetical protein